MAVTVRAAGVVPLRGDTASQLPPELVATLATNWTGLPLLVTVRGVVSWPATDWNTKVACRGNTHQRTEETVSDTAMVDACVARPARVGGRMGVIVTVAE